MHKKSLSLFFINPWKNLSKKDYVAGPIRRCGWNFYNCLQMPTQYFTVQLTIQNPKFRKPHVHLLNFLAYINRYKASIWVEAIMT